MDHMWNEYDWRRALAESTGGGYDRDGKITADDIAETFACDAGENDGPEWLAIVRLKDGRWAFIHAGCDYTGWDCQASGDVAYADSLDELCRMNMDDDQRARLGVDIFGERVR